MPDLNEERRPAGNGTASESLAGDFSSVPQDGPQGRYPVETVQRRYWARHLLDAGAGWPMYGSIAWTALPMDDPKRVAACVAAAEAYTRYFDDHEENLRREIENRRRSHKKWEDVEYQAAARAHREQWRHLGSGRVIDFAERQRQAEEARERMVERVRRNPDGRPGGGAA